MSDTSFAKFAARDAAIVGVALGVWRVAAPASAQASALGDFSGFVAGALLGVCAFVLHEWGHLLAALATGSVVQATPKLGSPFIFNFDARANSLRQFMLMSLGGFAATGLLVWSYYTQLPDPLLASRIARGAVLFLAFLGVTLELPLVLFALYKRAVPAAVAVRPPSRAEGSHA